VQGNHLGRGYKLLRSCDLSKLTCTSINLHSCTGGVGILVVLVSLPTSNTDIIFYQAKGQQVSGPQVLGKRHPE